MFEAPNKEHEEIRRTLRAFLRGQGWLVEPYSIMHRHVPVDLYARKKRKLIVEVKTTELETQRLHQIREAIGQLIFGAIHANHLAIVVPDSWLTWLQKNKHLAEELDRLAVSLENLEGQRKVFYDKRIKLLTLEQFRLWVASL